VLVRTARQAVALISAAPHRLPGIEVRTAAGAGTAGPLPSQSVLAWAWRSALLAPPWLPVRCSAGTVRAASPPAKVGEFPEEAPRLVRLAISKDSVCPSPGGIAVHRGE
jgi:hypothetical protein